MKTIHKVFLVIATLVLVFLIWALVFNKGGVLQTGWNALISPVNTTWQKISGNASATILPEWDAVEEGGGNYNGSDNLGEFTGP